jgi:secreted Zn-dependent insulinase-like peptidase
LFNAVKDELKKGYYNSALKPSKLMKSVYSSQYLRFVLMQLKSRELNNIVLKNVHWSSIEKYDAIDDISFEQLKMYSKQLKKRLYCRMLVQGNMLKSQAVNVMNIVTETLKYKPLIANTWPQVIKW